MAKIVILYYDYRTTILKSIFKNTACIFNKKVKNQYQS